MYSGFLAATMLILAYAGGKPFEQVIRRAGEQETADAEKVCLHH